MNKNGLNDMNVDKWAHKHDYEYKYMKGKYPSAYWQLLSVK